MLIGVPKEIKVQELRVGLNPGNVKELVAEGHQVMVETNAGIGISATDEDYIAAGATIVKDPKEIFAKADMIVKIKEPLKNECLMLREGQIIFTYLHLAADHEQAELLKKSKCVAIAYETVTDDRGGLPLLAPMSEVAGRMAIQEAAWALEKKNGGRGVLMGGVTGVAPANVVVLGGGVVGSCAARMAAGMEANVTIFDNRLQRLRELDLMFGPRVKKLYTTKEDIEKAVYEADVVVGAALVPGDDTPKLVTREMLKHMKKGAVMVDVAIDQGGCFETSHPTTHEDPIFEVDGIVHYCVTNMPGAVARTSTYAMNNASISFVKEIANKGYKRAILENKHLANGLNVCFGKITNKAVAHALNQDFVCPCEILK